MSSPMGRGNPNWVKGVSGNPAGRSRIDPALRTKLREMSPAIADRLYQITMGSESDSASVSAAKLLLAYAWGSPEALLEDAATGERAELTTDEKRAMARTLLAEQQQAETATDDDDAGETH